MFFLRFIPFVSVIRLFLYDEPISLKHLALDLFFAVLLVSFLTSYALNRIQSLFQ